MDNISLDPNIPNIDTGIFMTKSRPLNFSGTDVVLPEMATYLKSAGGGTIIWENTNTGEIGSWNCEAGETFFGRFNKLLATATIDTIAETMANGLYYWAVTGANLN
jgi:hypothetical protein